MDSTCKVALRLSAMRRAQDHKVKRWGQAEPTIRRTHVDGPYLSALDGSMVWLSPVERIMTKIGVWSAWDIEWRRFPLYEGLAA